MNLRRKISLLLALGSLLLLLGGCGNKNNSGAEHASADVLAPIQVELKVTPESVKIGENVKFEAKVTYQDQPVDDAKEVMFEVGREGGTDEDRFMETVSSSGDGLYVWETSFDQAGEYKAISHVTAKDQHSMPSVTFTVTE